MASGISCAICADSYMDSTDICSTKCGHIYHMSCLNHWIQQSNTCPMCNQSQPQPHRIYLDIDTTNEPSGSNTQQDNNSGKHIVLVKGLKPDQVTSPLYSLIHKLIIVMQVAITEEHIKDISKRGKKGNPSIQVSFKTKSHKDLFLQHRHKLKKNTDTTQIRIHELLNPETQALFDYSHKLRNANYNIFYVENNKVFVKKSKNSQPINILSKDQVDNLCVQQTNNREIAATTSNVRINHQILPTNNFERISDHLSTNVETLALFEYSQKLQSFGYEIVFENNRVLVNKISDGFFQQIDIASRSHVDHLILFENHKMARVELATPVVRNQMRITNDYPRNYPRDNDNSCNIL